MPDPANRAKQNVAAVVAVEEGLGQLEEQARHERTVAAGRERELRRRRDELRAVVRMPLLGPVAGEDGDEEEVDRAWRS